MQPKVIFKNSGRIRRIVDKLRQKAVHIDPASFTKVEGAADKIGRYRQNGIGNVAKQRKAQRLADEAKQMKKIRNGTIIGGTALGSYMYGKKKGVEETERRIYGG